MSQLIYIKSLHRPYNQNLNSVKWVCRFINKKNNNSQISKSDLYLEFYIYLLRKLYNLYKRNETESLTHGIPSYESIKKSYLHLKGISKEKKKKTIIHSISQRRDDVEKSIFSTYKATSYFINLSKNKLDFIDVNNRLNVDGIKLVSLKSNELKLSKKEKEVIFSSIIKNDFHFFVSLLLLKKVAKKINNLDINEIHYDFLVDRYNIKHFNFTEASQLNFSTVRDYWIKDLDILDKNFNIRKVFLEVIKQNSFEELFSEIKKQVDIYYTEKIITRSKFQKKVELFKKVYIMSPKNELGFIALQDIANEMHMGKLTFQKFISNFYEQEKSKSNIFFNNVVQAIAGKNQYFIRNRPVVNIKIKELN